MFKFQLNAGSGTALGLVIAALIALLISQITGDNSVWAWVIPLGVAIGASVGGGAAQQRKKGQS